jgi:hypothetical protein
VKDAAIKDNGNRYGGVFAAMPDAVTTGWFVMIWSSPFVFGPLSVKTAMLTMLVEFFLVHATGFFTAFGSDRSTSRLARIAMLLGLSLFYVMMISAFAWSFHGWWMLLAFAWLLVGKIVWVLQNPKPSDDSSNRQMLAWAGSVALFLGAVFLTSLADVPRWGMSADLQPGFGLDMHSQGIWESQPWRVVAFGVVYFGVTFLVKLAVGLFDARKTNTPDERTTRHFR